MRIPQPQAFSLSRLKSNMIVPVTIQNSTLTTRGRGIIIDELVIWGYGTYIFMI